MYGRMLRVSERVYGAMLVPYPREFRDAYGSQMVQVFRDASRETVDRTGIVGLVALWVRAALDLLLAGLAERRRANAATGRAERLMHTMLWRDPSRSNALFIIALNSLALAFFVFAVGVEGWEHRGQVVGVLGAFNLANIFLGIGELLYVVRRRVAAALLGIVPFIILGASSTVLVMRWAYQRGEVWIALLLLALLLVALGHSLWRYLFATRGGDVRQG